MIVLFPYVCTVCRTDSHWSAVKKALTEVSLHFAELHLHVSNDLKHHLCFFQKILIEEQTSDFIPTVEYTVSKLKIFTLE